MIARTRAFAVAPGLALAAGTALFAATLATPYELRVLTVAGGYALAVLGFQVVFGLAGALSLAQGTFFGLGGYCVGILGAGAGLPFELTMPAAVLAPAGLALVVAAPVLRLETHYFALATLGIAQVALLAAVNGETLTGGANGLAGVPGVVVFGLAVPRGLPLCLFVWAWVAAGAVLVGLLASGRWGLALAAVRRDPMTAAALGLGVPRLRLEAFVLSAVLAGAGGALIVHSQRVVSPAVLEFPVMVSILCMALVGGRGSVAGALLGALLLIHLPEWLRGLENAHLLAYGVILLATVVLLPAGIAGSFARLVPRLSSTGAGRAPDTAGGPGSVVPPRAAPIPSAVAGTTLLAVAGLAKAFGGVRAVDGVTFTLAPGTILGLIGPNGSGKTTLLNLLAGQENPDRGTIRFAGAEIAGIGPRRIAGLGIARTFQTVRLPADQTALAAVATARLATADRSLAEVEARARLFLSLTGAAPAADQPCGRLVPGHRRRVELARALARDPRLLLLDEPAVGLGQAERHALGTLLRTVAGAGVAMVLVDHDIEFLGAVADRILCLDRGRVVFDGPVAAVAEDPAIRRAYFGTFAGEGAT